MKIMLSKISVCLLSMSVLLISTIAIANEQSVRITDVRFTDLNDPTHPELYADEITGVYLRKGTDPIPNVRGLGEMDDRLEITEAEVEIDAETRRNALQFVRQGPIWLGLVCGLGARHERQHQGNGKNPRMTIARHELSSFSQPRALLAQGNRYSTG